MELKQYPEAIDDLDTAIKLDPTNEEAYFNRGFAKREIEQYEDAIDDLNRVLDIDSDHVAALHNLKYCLCALNKDTEALPIMNRVIKLNPDWYSYMGRAGIKEALADVEGQKKDEDKAWEIGHDLWI